jgi:hypothetical protein
MGWTSRKAWIVVSMAALVALRADADQTADGLNATAGNQNIGWCGGCVSVGWYYVPQTAYELSGIQTNFAPGIGSDRTVTVELLTERRAVGGHVIASGTFDSSTARGTLGGATFGTPVGLVAGSRYFVGFRNVAGLGINTTNDGGATNLGAFGLFLDNDGTNDGDYQLRGGLPTTGSPQDQPILRFLKPDTPTGVAPTPGQALALTVRKAAVTFKAKPLGDSWTLTCSVPGALGSFDPTAGFVLSIVKDDGTVIAALNMPGGQKWKVTNKPSWSIRDNKGGAVGDPTVVETVSAKLNKKTGLFDMKVTVKRVNLTDPGAGNYTTILNRGNGTNVDMDRRGWRSKTVKGGTKLLAP